MKSALKFSCASLNMSNDFLTEYFRKRADEVLPFSVLFDIGQMKNTFAFFGAATAHSKKPCKTSVGFAISGIAEQTRTVGQIQTAAHDKARWCLRLLDMRMRKNNA